MEVVLYKKRVFLLLIMVVFITLVPEIIPKIEAAEKSDTYHFIMNLQFEIYSIDLKTETIYSSNYNLLFKAENPDTPNFTAVILKPHFYQAIRTESSNETGTNQVRDYVEITDPRLLVINRWYLNPRRFLPWYGSPFDYYELSFLIAVNMSTQLALNDTWFIMPISMQGDWQWEEKPQVQKLDGIPSNETLIIHGLSPEMFYNRGGQEMIDFYLVTETFRFPEIRSMRIFLLYLVPSIAILVILIFSLYRSDRLTRSDFLTIYLGTALFILPFLVSFYQFAPSKVLTWQEIVFYLSFIISTLVIIGAILLKKDKEPSENKTSEQKLKSDTNNSPDKPVEKMDWQVQRMISELSSRENSTLVVSTLAASVSLSILAFVLQPNGSKVFDVAMIMGLLFAMIGFSYREATILGVDTKDYAKLNEYAPSLRGEATRKRKAINFLRMFLIRFLLLIPVATWILVMYDLGMSWIIPTCITIGAVSSLFSIAEYALRYDNDP